MSANPNREWSVNTLCGKQETPFKILSTLQIYSLSFTRYLRSLLSMLIGCHITLCIAIFIPTHLTTSRHQPPMTNLSDILITLLYPLFSQYSNNTTMAHFLLCMLYDPPSDIYPPLNFLPNISKRSHKCSSPSTFFITLSHYVSSQHYISTYV